MAPSCSWGLWTLPVEQVCVVNAKRKHPQLWTDLFDICRVWGTVGKHLIGPMLLYFALAMQEGVIDDTLRVIEFGRCRVERRQGGVLQHCGWCDVGTVLGERRFFSMPANWPDASFRIATPLALLLFIPRQSFNGVLENYPSEQQRFRLVKETNKTDGGNARRDHDAASILQGCGPGFLQAIAGCIRTVTYKIGQTITVQGAVDSGSMCPKGLGHPMQCRP
eukprot:Skav212371  [mRNA]  locus=scaffold1983:24030:26540:+ [translate_table: standard]